MGITHETALQNALDSLGLSEEYSLHINHQVDVRKKEENKRKYFLVRNMIGSGLMTYNECNHFIFGINFQKTNK